MIHTLVTAIYYTTPQSRMGGRGYTFKYYEAPFRNILNLNTNIVVYTQESQYNDLMCFFEKYNFKNYKIYVFDLNNYKNSDLIFQLKENEKIIDKNGLYNNKSIIENDRNHHLCLLKPFFIKHAIENSHFLSDNFYWIDGGLFHHGIFPETYGGIERFTHINEEKYWPINKNNISNPYFIEKLHNKSKSEIIFIGNDQHPPVFFWKDFCHQPRITHIIGGFFGGKKEIILELFDDFDLLTTKILKENHLILEEPVLSMLYSMKYSNYNYIPFDTWYHDIPTDPNYFGLNSDSKSFYKIFI